MDKVKIKKHASFSLFWLAGWLFTIGFLHLHFWRGVLAIIIWPYHIGHAVSMMVH